jgi:hypothetical protein
MHRLNLEENSSRVPDDKFCIYEANHEHYQQRLHNDLQLGLTHVIGYNDLQAWEPNICKNGPNTQ